MANEHVVGIDRRCVLAGASTSLILTQIPGAHAAGATAPASNAASPGVEMIDTTLKVNGAEHKLSLDSRTTLLDALRDHLAMYGTKKGCDHGQCGACTVIVNGRRINSCLTLAATQDGSEVTTVEGLGKPGDLGKVQAAFVAHDGYQCGYCTPGQICSATAMLKEFEAGIPSHVTGDLNDPKPSLAEFRERMSGNICRCGAYSNIIDALSEVSGVRA